VAVTVLASFAILTMQVVFIVGVKNKKTFCTLVIVFAILMPVFDLNQSIII